MTRLTSISSVSAVLIVLALALAAPVRADMYVDDGDFELSYPDFSASWAADGDEVAPERGFGTTFALFAEEARPSEDYVTSSLTQEIDDLTSGETYNISFDLYILSEMTGMSETDSFVVTFGTEDIYSWSNDTDEPLAEYEVYEHVVGTVTPGADAVDLSFVFQTDGLHSESLTSIELDNVSISVVPVPGAALLGVLGLGMAGGRLRRDARRRS